MDEEGTYTMKKRSFLKLATIAKVYEDIYDTLINGKPKVVKDEETLLQIEMLEKVSIHSHDKESEENMKLAILVLGKSCKNFYRSRKIYRRFN